MDSCLRSRAPDFLVFFVCDEIKLPINDSPNLGITVGILKTLADTLDIGIEWYSEGDAKKCALGKLSATKDEMVKRMGVVYLSHWETGVKYIDEAVADALAIHYVARRLSSTLKLVK